MATMQLTPAATGAQTYVLETANYPRVLVGADGLAGAETVLSVAAPTVILAGTGSYLLTKGATAGAASLYMSAIPHPGS